MTTSAAKINMADFELSNIDVSMDKVFQEYPTTILPQKLNKRTGKAKNCLKYEQIDVNIFEKEARMITCHASLERIHLWIKTLDILYYDFLGSKNDLDIKSGVIFQNAGQILIIKEIQSSLKFLN